MKTNAINCTILSAAIIILSSCGDNNKGGQAAPGQNPPPPANYQVFEVTPQDATLHTSYPTVLQGQQTIDIRPKIDGYIDKIYVDEGSVVKKGQPLFKLSAPQYEQTVQSSIAAINSARADINSAEIAVNKTRPLVDKGIISRYELETDQNTLNTKRAALAQAQTNLATAKVNQGYTLVTSPVDGVVGTIPYRLGSLITSTTSSPLTTVANIGNVYAYFSLNEKQLLDFSRTVKGSTLDQKIKNTPLINLTLADGSTYPEKGKIQTISGLLNTATGTASLRAAFPNPLHLLRSGATGSVDVPQALTSALLIPQKSAYEQQGKYFVFVLEQNNIVRSREIKIMELTAGQYYVVTEGIKAGEKLVLDGSISLKDSTKIIPQALVASKVYQDVN